MEQLSVVLAVKQVVCMRESEKCSASSMRKQLAYRRREHRSRNEERIASLERLHREDSHPTGGGFLSTVAV
jgi:hypothetical protein